MFILDVCFLVYNLFADYGFYIYIEANGKSKNNVAQLLSKPVVHRKSQCLHFWYHMYGGQIGSLSVYQKKGMSMYNIWEKGNNQGNQWKQAKVELPPYEYYQIVIEGKLRNSDFHRNGDIAIDDIYVDEGECSGKYAFFCFFFFFFVLLVTEKRG